MQISSDARIEILKDSEERPLLVLESRQMTAIAFGVVLVIGIVACTAYLVGRRLPERAAASGPAPSVHTRRARTAPRPAVSSPLPETKAAPATPAPQAVSVPAPAPPVQAQAVKPPAPVQNPAPAVSSTGLIQPEKGQNFLQVGNLTPDTVKPFVESLNAKGFRAKLAPGADSNSVRILIGPLKSAEVAPISADLTKAGFANFPKFY